MSSADPVNTSKSNPRTRVPAGRRTPDFLGLGGMRCGSTTLWEMLRVQPDVFLPEQKELHYFDNKDGLWDEGLEAYLDFFDDARPDQVCGEITPEYLTVEYCTTRMYELVPNARLLVVLRDPVSRAWSHYRMSVNWGAETLPFEKALRTEDERLDQAGRGPEGILGNVAFSYLERGRYVEHLKRLEETFSREQLLVLILPEFRDDRPGVMRRVREHLGLPAEPPGGELDRPPETTNALPPMPRNLKLHQAVHRLQAPARRGETLLHRVARKGLDTVKRLNTATGEAKPDDAVNAWLRDYYAPFDAELEQWLGKPVPWRAG